MLVTDFILLSSILVQKPDEDEDEAWDKEKARQIDEGVNSLGEPAKKITDDLLKKLRKGEFNP